MNEMWCAFDFNCILSKQLIKFYIEKYCWVMCITVVVLFFLIVMFRLMVEGQPYYRVGHMPCWGMWQNLNMQSDIREASKKKPHSQHRSHKMRADAERWDSRGGMRELRAQCHKWTSERRELRAQARGGRQEHRAQMKTNLRRIESRWIVEIEPTTKSYCDRVSESSNPNGEDEMRWTD